MSKFIEFYPIGADLPPAPIGCEYKVFTYLPTNERVGSGWPAEGAAVWLVRKPVPKRMYLVPFDFKECWEMKRYAQEAQAKRGKWKQSDDALIATRPVLNQLLTDTQWEDGKQRTPCNLKIRFGEGQCSVVLSDEENEMSIATTGDTLEAVLDILEDALAQNKVRWKPWGNFNKKKK